MPKVRKIRGDPVVRGGALSEQIEDEHLAKATGRKKIKKRRDDETEYVESDLTKRILSQARQQQQELEEECGIQNSSFVLRQSSDVPVKLGTGLRKGDNDDGDDEDRLESEAEEMLVAEGMQGQEEVEPEDDKAFQAWLSSKKEHGEENILEKFHKQRTEVDTVLSDGCASSNLTPRQVEVCKAHADFMKKYKSGKLPLFIKRLPYFEFWEECLKLLQPEEWSAASVYAVTRVFASNLNSALAQRFYCLFLLPRIRDDIREYKRLNFHLMEALKKSMFKIHAFFKGIILPLCQAEDCTVKEAHVVSSVLRDSNIASSVAGVAIETIAAMSYQGPRFIVLRTLLDKKYALAYSVVDSVHASFLRTASEDAELTTLWHQCLLTFVQRHKEDFTAQQKEQLHVLVNKHRHHEITQEIHRELDSSGCRLIG